MTMTPSNVIEQRPTTPAERAHMERTLTDLRARAKAGDAQAQRDLGCAYHWGEESWDDLLPRDFELSRHWYVMAAEQGHLEAMSDVFLMLLYGEGGPPDVERGMRYLRFVASRPRWTPYSESAAELLAAYHQSGEYGCAVDPSEVKRWLAVAADQRRKYRGVLRKSKGGLLE